MTGALRERDGAADAAFSSSQRFCRARWQALALQSWREANDDHIGLIAAGVAFYGFIALVPLLDAIVLSYGLLAKPATVIHDMHRLAATLPPEPAKLIGLQMIDMVKSSDDKKGLGLVGALALALFGTRNAAGSVIAALNVAFEVRETRGMVVLNLMALALAGAAVLAAIMAVIAMAAVSVFSRQLEGSPELLLGLHKTVWCAALALWGVVAAATLYRYAPSHEEHRRIFIAPGAVMTAICWTVLTLGFGAYASRVAHFNVIYGSLSAVVMMLTWLYLSSYALLFGAELNCEWAREAFTDENGRFEQQHVAQEPPACPSTRAAPP